MSFVADTTTGTIGGANPHLYSGPPSLAASAGMSQDPSPNRTSLSPGVSGSAVFNFIPATGDDSRVIGPIGSQPRANLRSSSQFSQGIDFPSNRSSPSVHSLPSPGVQPQMNSGGSLANECSGSQPNSRLRGDCDSVKRVVGSVPLRGSLQSSPDASSGMPPGRSPWSVCVQDPKSTFRQMEPTPSGVGSMKLHQGGGGGGGGSGAVVVKPFLAAFGEDDDDDDDNIVGAADVLVGGGNRNSIVSTSITTEQAPIFAAPQQSQQSQPQPQQQQAPRRAKGSIPTEQVRLPVGSFNHLHRLANLKHPYQFSVKGDDDEDSTVYEGFTSEQWDRDIELLSITQQEVDDLREARAGRPFSRQPFAGDKEGEEGVTAAEEAAVAEEEDPQTEGGGDGGGGTAQEGMNDIAQEWQVLQQYVLDTEEGGPDQTDSPAAPSTSLAATNEHATFAYLRFKYTHGIYRVHATTEGPPVINIGDMVVVRGVHRHEVGEGDAPPVGSAENVGTVVGDATSLVLRVAQQSASSGNAINLDPSSNVLSIADYSIDTILRCTTNKDRKMFYQARRREASTSSCAERIVQTLKLPLRICDCEFQSDFGRLILFYRLSASHLQALVSAAIAKSPEATKDAVEEEIVAASVRVLLKEMYNQFHCRVWALNWDSELETIFPLGQLGPVRGRQRRDARGRIVPLPVLPAVRLPRPVNVVASVVKRKKKRKNEELVNLPSHQVGGGLVGGGDPSVMGGMAMMAGAGASMNSPPMYVNSNHHSSSPSATGVPYLPPSPASTSSSFIASLGATVGMPTPAGSPGGAAPLFFYSYDSPNSFGGGSVPQQQQHSHQQVLQVNGGMYSAYPMAGGYPSPINPAHQTTYVAPTQSYTGLQQQQPQPQLQQQYQQHSQPQFQQRQPHQYTQQQLQQQQPQQYTQQQLQQQQQPHFSTYNMQSQPSSYAPSQQQQIPMAPPRPSVSGSYY